MGKVKHYRDPNKTPVEQTLEVVANARPDGVKEHRPRNDRKRKVYRDPVTGKLNVGGWRGQEGSLRALDAHRWRTTFGNMRPCARPNCGQPPVRGSKFCRHHGGRPLATARKAGDPLWRPKKSSMLRREIRRLVNHGHVPVELTKQKIFRDLLAAVKYGVRAEDYPGLDFRQRGARWMAMAYLVLEFIRAWELMEQQEHQPWHDAVAKANALGFSSY